MTQKDYMRLVSFLKNAKRNDEALQAEKDIDIKHPEFKDKRVSNLKRVKEYLNKANEYGTDIVYITTNSHCRFCKPYNNKKFSISGRSSKYAKLPDIIKNEGGFCNECIVGISLEFFEM